MDWWTDSAARVRREGGVPVTRQRRRSCSRDAAVFTKGTRIWRCVPSALTPVWTVSPVMRVAVLDARSQHEDARCRDAANGNAVVSSMYVS